MSFLAYKVLLENSLYTNPIERANLIADKQKLMDALLINFFGFLGLYAISDKRGQMQHYSSEEKKLIPSMIGDDNKDVSLVIRLALDAGILKQTGANNMTKLLALIKQKQVKADGIDNAKVREFVGDILYTAHPPTSYIKQAFNDFVEGRSDVAHLAKSFFEVVRTKKDYHPITVEFRALALTYRPYFDQLPDVVALTPGAIPHSHAADSLNNRVKKGQTRSPTSHVPTPGNSTTPAAVATAAAPVSVKPKKTKVVSPPTPVAPVVVQGYTTEFFTEALNARGQKEINTVFAKFGVELPSKDAHALNLFVGRFQSWKLEFSSSLIDKTPAFPKLNNTNCNEGAGKYLKKYDKRYYLQYMKMTWDSFTFYNTLEDSLALVNHMFDNSHNGNTIVEKIGSGGVFMWYNDQIVDRVVQILTDVQPTVQSVEESVKKLEPFDKYVKIFNTRIVPIRSAPLFNSMVPADAVLTQMETITADPYTPLARFNLGSDAQIIKHPGGGRTVIIPEHQFNSLLPIQQETLKLLGDKLKVQTAADTKAILSAAIDKGMLSETDIINAMRLLNNYFNKSLIARDEYESNLMKLFSASFTLTSKIVRTATINNPGTFVDNHIAELAALLSDNVGSAADSFLRLSSNTLKTIPLSYSTKTQEEWLKFYCNNSNNWSISADVMETLAETIGQNHTPNNHLLKDAFILSNKLFYVLWKNSASDQIISDDIVSYIKSGNSTSTIPSFFKNIRYGIIESASAQSSGLIDIWGDLIRTNSNLYNLFFEEISTAPTETLLLWIKTDNSYEGIGFAVACLGVIPDNVEKMITTLWEEELVLKGNKNIVIKNKDSVLAKIGEKVIRKVFAESKNTSFSAFDKVEMSRYIPSLAKEQIEKLSENDIKSAIQTDIDRGWLDTYSRVGSNWLKFVDTIKNLKDTEGCPANLGRLANVAFRLARDNKKTFKKQFRDEFAEEVLGLMMSDVESKDAQQAFSELEDTLLKKRFLTQFINVELATKAQEELNKRDLAIVPQKPLTKSQVAAVLKLNNVEIPFDRALIKSTDIKQVQRQVEAHTKKQGFQELAVKEVTKTTKELVEESFRLDQYNRHAHGDTAFLVKKMFDVAIPRQTNGYPTWKAAHPAATEMLQFHGTASLPAAMIMRYGFTVVDQNIAHAAGIKYTGKMLGDGVYCSNVIDKVGQYLGESGMTRRFGTTGYLFEMTAQMDQWGKKVSKQSPNDFASAGTGRFGEGYSTVSPEWAMRDPEQFKIYRCYYVEIISKTKMKELREEYLKESFTPKKFDEFLKEARKEKVNTKKISYCFVDGAIPVSKTEAKDFDEIDMSKFPNATLDFNRQGVVLQFDCPIGQEEFHETVIWTRVFMQNRDKLELFLKLLTGK